MWTQKKYFFPPSNELSLRVRDPCGTVVFVHSLPMKSRKSLAFDVYDDFAQHFGLVHEMHTTCNIDAVSKLAALLIVFSQLARPEIKRKTSMCVPVHSKYLFIVNRAGDASLPQVPIPRVMQQAVFPFSFRSQSVIAKCDEDQLFWNLFLHTSILKYIYISLTKTLHQPQNSLRPLLPVSF